MAFFARDQAIAALIGHLGLVFKRQFLAVSFG